MVPVQHPTLTKSISRSSLISGISNKRLSISSFRTNKKCSAILPSPLFGHSERFCWWQRGIPRPNSRRVPNLDRGGNSLPHHIHPPSSTGVVCVDWGLPDHGSRTRGKSDDNGCDDDASGSEGCVGSATGCIAPDIKGSPRYASGKVSEAPGMIFSQEELNPSGIFSSPVRSGEGGPL